MNTVTIEYPMPCLSRVNLPQKGDYKGVVNISEDGYKLIAFVQVDRECC